jgi:hypothetical protein
MKFEPGVLLFFGIFGAVLFTFLYKIIRYRGFKAAMFGSTIDRTVGEVEGTGQGLVRVRLRVHALSGERDRAVGIELVATSVASYQMLPIMLSSEGTRELVTLLQKACD